MSNLSFVSELTERVVADQLTVHLEEDGLQGAHRRGHGTEAALLRVKGDIDLALDAGDGVLLVLLYLSAAFDTTDHNILIDRLEHRSSLWCDLHCPRNYTPRPHSEGAYRGDALGTN